jgi:monofunctional biosynthetic peptidoglycan transglycosylase
LPKRREAIAPRGFTRRYGNMILARIGVVRRSGLDACVYEGAPMRPERLEPIRRPSRPIPRAPVAIPGEEFETPMAVPVPVTEEAPPAAPLEEPPPAAASELPASPSELAPAEPPPTEANGQ